MIMSLLLCVNHEAKRQGASKGRMSVHVMTFAKQLRSKQF